MLLGFAVTENDVLMVLNYIKGSNLAELLGFKKTQKVRVGWNYLTQIYIFLMQVLNI